MAVAGVSRRHARLVRDQRGFVLDDLGSRNGIVCDGSRRSSVVLTHGRVVQLGEAFVTIEELSTAEAEIGLPLDQDAPESKPGSGGVDLQTPASAALHLVRQIEAVAHGSLSQPPRRDLLDAARRILGARALVLASIDRHGELVVRDCWGNVDEHAAAVLEAGLLGTFRGSGGSGESPARVSTTRSRVPEPGDGKSLPPGLLLARSRESDEVWFAALFPDAVTTPPAWARDFFGYLAERLTHGALLEVREAEARAPTSRRELVFPAGMVVGSSPAMQCLVDQLQAIAQSDLDVLILGETGTGKELIARAIHASGSGSKGPFVAINCAAIPADLLEAELFGVTARVATGVDPRPGLFVQAEGGTLLLDEIGELPERLQAKLLRVLQEREVLPIGSSSPRRVDVRVLSASNREIGQLAARGEFRADLYYRLRGLELHVAPLRERREDLPELVAAFATAAARKYRKRVLGVSRRALGLLLAHDWPGNVRELETEVSRAVLLCPSGGALDSRAFPQLREAVERRAAAAPSAAGLPVKPVAKAPPGGSTLLQQRLDEVERGALLEALSASRGNKSRAARLLGITRNGLALKLRRLGIE